MMMLEALAAALVGVAALWLVLGPLIRPGRSAPPIFEPLDPEETPRGAALAALKEIDFDRETGKLSDADYLLLRTKYTAAALEALRADSPDVTPDSIEAMVSARVRSLRSAGSARPECSTCGPRPEADAVFCSTCGHSLAGAQSTNIGPLSGSVRTPNPTPITPDPLQAQ